MRNRFGRSGLAINSRPNATALRAGSAYLMRPGAERWQSTMLDGSAFLTAADAASIPLTDRRVQMLGAGGAGRAVAMAITERRPALLSIADPETERAESLAADVAREFRVTRVMVQLGASETLVTCSPIGMGDDTALPLPTSLIPQSGAVYDTINRPDTPLIRLAQARGCVTDHGRSIILAQIELLICFLFRSGP